MQQTCDVEFPSRTFFKFSFLPSGLRTVHLRTVHLHRPSRRGCRHRLGCQRTSSILRSQHHRHRHHLLLRDSAARGSASPMGLRLGGALPRLKLVHGGKGGGEGAGAAWRGSVAARRCCAPRGRSCTGEIQFATTASGSGVHGRRRRARVAEQRARGGGGERGARSSAASGATPSKERRQHDEGLRPPAASVRLVRFKTKNLYKKPKPISSVSRSGDNRSASDSCKPKFLQTKSTEPKCRF